MELTDKVAVVTGGARGIGRAMCRRFQDEGARAVVVADVDCEAAEKVAGDVGGLAVACDVGVESDVVRLVQRTLSEFGRIDLFVSNAGITVKGGVETPNSEWQKLWDVNVMSRIYAARAVIPHMLAQGTGYLLQTASGAALLTEIGSAAYSVTKQSDLALSEWLRIQYQRRGIGVSCLCPLGVETDMLDPDDPVHQFLAVSAVSADDVAQSVIEGLRDERFLILPHPQVAEYFEIKATDYDRWLRGMQRLNEKLSWTRQTVKTNDTSAGRTSAMLDGGGTV